MIGWMTRELFAVSPVLWLPVIALVLFVTVFVAVSTRTLRASDQSIDARARLPLDDGERALGKREKGGAA